MKRTLFCLVLALALLSSAALAATYDGMVEDAAMHSLLLHTDDGRHIDLLMDDDTQSDDFGLFSRVEVEAKEDGTAQKITRLTSLFGTVTDGSMHVLTVESAGKSYVFSLGEDPNVIGESGLSIGANVEVVYLGSALAADSTDVQDVRVVAVYSENSLTGTVDDYDLDDGELEIKVGSREYEFSLDYAGARVSVDAAVAEDRQATVYFFGNLSEDKEHLDDAQQVIVSRVTP